MAMIMSDKDWQAEDDMRTLMRAEEIRKDKKRFAAAQKCAQCKLKEMQSAFPNTNTKEKTSK